MPVIRQNFVQAHALAREIGTLFSRLGLDAVEQKVGNRYIRGREVNSTQVLLMWPCGQGVAPGAGYYVRSDGRLCTINLSVYDKYSNLYDYDDPRRALIAEPVDETQETRDWLNPENTAGLVAALRRMLAKLQA